MSIATDVKVIALEREVDALKATVKRLEAQMQGLANEVMRGKNVPRR